MAEEETTPHRKVEKFDLGWVKRKLANILHTGKRDPHGEPEGVITNPNQFDDSYRSSTVILCKDMADILVKRYPGWSWAIKPNAFGRMIDVYCLQLHSEYGYTIRMVDIMNDPRRRQATIAGHEILRRFGMPDRMDIDRLKAAPRDARGQCIPDISDFADKKRVREAEIARKLATGEWSIVEADGHRYVRKNR
jgi:hypothetical protein